MTALRRIAGFQDSIAMYARTSNGVWVGVNKRPFNEHNKSGLPKCSINQGLTGF